MLCYLPSEKVVLVGFRGVNPFLEGIWNPTLLKIPARTTTLCKVLSTFRSAWPATAPKCKPSVKQPPKKSERVNWAAKEC